MPETKKLSAKEYVNSLGCECPVCHAWSGAETPFTYSDLRVDGVDVFQDVECGQCQSQWADHYVLTEYHINVVGPAMATVGELSAQYRSDPIGHPENTKSEWRKYVAEGYTDMSYAEWLWERFQ